MMLNSAFPSAQMIPTGAGFQRIHCAINDQPPIELEYSGTPYIWQCGGIIWDQERYRRTLGQNIETGHKVVTHPERWVQRIPREADLRHPNHRDLVLRKSELSVRLCFHWNRKELDQETLDRFVREWQEIERTLKAWEPEGDKLKARYAQWVKTNSTEQIFQDVPTPAWMEHWQTGKQMWRHRRIDPVTGEVLQGLISDNEKRAEILSQHDIQLRATEDLRAKNMELERQMRSFQKQYDDMAGAIENAKSAADENEKLRARLAELEAQLDKPPKTRKS